MNRLLSQLVYKRIQDIHSTPRIITLHDWDQLGQDVREYAFAANPDARIIGLESYKGVYSGQVVNGYTWYVGPIDQPSPAFFGDALSQIERFLWDEIDRQSGPRAELPFLLGVGQGAIMSIAAAAAVPDLISGVIAIDAILPVVPGWNPPLAPLDGLPILILTDPDRTVKEGVLAGQALAKTLCDWGSHVHMESVQSPTRTIPAKLLANWLDAQKSRFYVHPLE